MPGPRVDNRFAQATLAFQARFLTAALEQHGGNRSQTARALGMSRASLINAIRRLRLAGPGRSAEAAS
jgi:DNA-binding NtrC family response regulator